MKKITQEQFDGMIRAVEEYRDNPVMGGMPKFVDCELTGLDFKGANLSYCDFKRCNINNCNMKNVAMRYADVVGCSINFTDMSYADLEMAYFDGTTFNYVSLVRANMKFTSLLDLVFKSVDFRAANCTSANFAGMDIKNSNFHTAILEEDDPRLSSEIECTLEMIHKLSTEKSVLVEKYLENLEDMRGNVEDISSMLDEKLELLGRYFKAAGEWGE